MMYQSLLEKAVTAKYNSKVTLTVNQWSIITNIILITFLYENFFTCSYMFSYLS